MSLFERSVVTSFSSTLSNSTRHTHGRPSSAPANAGETHVSSISGSVCIGSPASKSEEVSALSLDDRTVVSPSPPCATIGIDEPHDVGARIRGCRISAGVSIEDLAATLGVSRVRMRLIEAGGVPLPASDLVLVAGRLGVTIDEFFAELQAQPESRTLQLQAEIFKFCLAMPDAHFQSFAHFVQALAVQANETA
jgi:transcriptional regulator with XRE-family HTH domain